MTTFNMVQGRCFCSANYIVGGARLQNVGGEMGSGFWTCFFALASLHTSLSSECVQNASTSGENRRCSG